MNKSEALAMAPIVDALLAARTDPNTDLKTLTRSLVAECRRLGLDDFLRELFRDVISGEPGCITKPRESLGSRRNGST